MKPFNLERALAGDPVVTRDGRPVKIAGYNEEKERIAAWVSGTILDCWNIKGKCISTDKMAKVLDLKMALTERKEWIVRYQHGTPIEEIEPYIAVSGPFYSLEKAQRFAKDTEGTIHEITIHE
jgi:hypothetical protein